ncbi:hypothetical protein AB0395_21955 [Streptosporangium sp. NPDC051023]
MTNSKPAPKPTPATVGDNTTGDTTFEEQGKFGFGSALVSCFTRPGTPS